MGLAHAKGLLTTATMMFGHVETLEDRVDHLLALRDQQDRTQGFTAFIPWTFQPDNTALAARKATSIEYLRLLALSRLVLDNIPNLQVSWVTMGSKIGQLGLFFGANDFGSTMIEENVVAASGVSFRMSEAKMQEVIQAAGFEPRQRRMDYALV
jgi:cyclic dehypoxanthinyl futalosine synthase